MSRARIGVAATAALLLLVGGCAGEEEPGPQGTEVPHSNVKVDTPQLRAQKRQAGIEDCPTSTGEPPATQALPDMTLPCLGGGPAVNLSTLRGPLVINLFAQWCEPCRDELPFYQRLHEDAKGKVRVIGLDYLDTQPGGALALAELTGVTYPLLADPDGALRQEWRVRGLPGVVFVDAHGRVTTPDGRPEFTVIRSYRQLTSLVREYLGVTV